MRRRWVSEAGERFHGNRTRRTELVWPGKYDEEGNRREVPRANLPFQVIETVNESRATRETKKAAGLSLFDMWQGDEGETFEEGWRNKLIWGDNLLVMSSLLTTYAGKIDLIYIDPPFAVGADFSFKTVIGEDGTELSKQQSVIEEKAYRDTWGRYGPGRELDSYLEMMAPRLSLLRELLSARGSLFVHADYRASSALRFVLDDVFGPDCFLNEIVWHYKRWPTPAREYQKMHDNILCYVKKKGEHIFNRQYGERTAETQRRWQNQRIVASHDAEGARLPSDYGGAESPGAPLDDTWDIPLIAPVAHERTGFATQKPKALLERILLGASDEGSLVADFFCGSGTTLEVAESLGRRWIGCDLGRWGIHVSRKRLLGVEGCRPFELLNLGKYERQFWQGVAFGLGAHKVTERALYEYISFVLKLYGAQPIPGLSLLHGRKGVAAVHVGSVDAPVTIDEVASALRESVALGQKELHVLGWEWEMGLVGPSADGSGQGGLMQEEARRYGIKLLLLQIPREVMEEQAVERGDVRFFELAYLEVGLEQPNGPLSARVSLEDFVIPNTELIPEEVRERVQKWSDYVDYWAVDWDFRNDSFTQGWVAYRTRRHRGLPLVSDEHEYEKSGTYRVAVKAIDVFGNDTTRVLKMETGQ